MNSIADGNVTHEIESFFVRDAKRWYDLSDVHQGRFLWGHPREYPCIVQAVTLKGSRRQIRCYAFFDATHAANLFAMSSDKHRKVLLDQMTKSHQEETLEQTSARNLGVKS